VLFLNIFRRSLTGNSSAGVDRDDVDVDSVLAVPAIQVAVDPFGGQRTRRKADPIRDVRPIERR
jgi:hypothetical protein